MLGAADSLQFCSGHPFELFQPELIRDHSALANILS